MRRLGVRVPHGAPMKIVLRQKSYFYCKNIKSVGTRTQRSASPPSFACGYAVRFALRIACCSPGKKAQGPLRRENVRWTLEQQRLQTCEACAGGRMHSIRKSPSWRAKSKTLIVSVSVFDLHAYHSIFCIFSRMRPRTFFSILDTCTCDIPSTDAICCCVISRKYRSTII